MASWAGLIDRFAAADATVGVIGLGYVGIPVALAFAEAGFKVVGVDTDAARIDTLKEGRSGLLEVADERIATQLETGRLRVTTSYRSLARADAILICVPTPITEGRPDVSAIEKAARSIGALKPQGKLVVLESTTYPGTTEELVRPLLEAKGLAEGKDFLLAYSPERIDPGSASPAFEEIPKVVGGVSEDASRAAEALYGRVVPKVVTVSSARAAEMAKLMENTFRHVNIALVNEIALYAHDLGVDIWEVIEAAASKPFGFMPFWPSAGWGGHCIPLDPSYLSYKVRLDRAHEVRFVELAHTINAEMPRYIVQRIGELLNEHGKAIRSSRVLGIGLAYKEGVADTRGSSALKVLEALAKRGAEISYSDPLVPEIEIGGRLVASTTLDADNVTEQDVVVVFIPQSGIDLDLVAARASLIFDCCNAVRSNLSNVVKL